MNAEYTSENEEFIDLLQQSGWSQAEAARHLKVTPNHVNMIVRRGAKPSSTLLELFRIKVAQKKNAKQHALMPRIVALTDRIQGLDPAKRELMLEVLETLLQGYQRQHVTA